MNELTLMSQLVGAITSKDKEGMWGDLHGHYDIDLREYKRKNLYIREQTFKMMKYEPHEAQWKFHNAVPHIENVQTRKGTIDGCEHQEFNYLLNPKDPSQVTRTCKACNAEYKNIYHNRFRCIIAAARWGKSLSVGKEGLLPLLWPGLNADGTINKEKAPRVYVYAPSYNVGRHEFNYLVQGMEELGLTPERYQYSPNTGHLYARWPWGAEVAVKSWDRPKSILGDEIDEAILCEASNLAMLIFERYIRARMGSRLAYAILGSTPNGIGEFLESFYERGQNPTDKEVWSSSFGLLSNPHHPREDYETAKATLDPRTFAEQYEGKFISMAGLVFDTFDRDVHIKEQIKHPAELPEGSQVVFSIDFGSSAPTGAIMGYWDQDGGFHVLGEYYVAGYNIKHHFNTFLKDWLLLWQPEWMVYDFAQKDSAQFLQDEVAALEEAGEVKFNRLKMIPCKKGKKNGIERIRQLLHVNPNTEKSLLEADPTCEKFVFEMLHYANKKSPDGRILDEPANGNDHLMDALEYAVATSYEDAELRRDRKDMLDMGKDKPAKQIHQIMVDKMREAAEEQEEDMEDDWDDEDEDEDDDEGESYMDYGE